MSARHQTNRLLLILLGVMTILFVIYYAVYLGLVGKVYLLTGVDPISKQNLFYVQPKYSTESQFVRRMMAPAHRLDRRLRYDYWTTVESSNGVKWKNPIQ